MRLSLASVSLDVIFDIDFCGAQFKKIFFCYNLDEKAIITISVIILPCQFFSDIYTMKVWLWMQI